MKSFCLSFCLIFVFLSGCQHSSYNNNLPEEANTKDALALNLQLGMEYLKRHDTPRAKSKFLKALQLNPNSADVYGALAYYFEKTGDLQEANKYYNKALVLAPRSGAHLNNYGTYLCRLGKYKESDMYFQKAVNDLNYLNTGKAYENAGLCAAQIPDDAKALTYFKKALEHDRKRKQSLYELTSLKIKQNQVNDALFYLQKYEKLVLADKRLLRLAITTAHKAENFQLEAKYRMHLGS